MKKKLIFVDIKNEVHCIRCGQVTKREEALVMKHILGLKTIFPLCTECYATLIEQLP